MGNVSLQAKQIKMKKSADLFSGFFIIHYTSLEKYPKTN
jgi:hypothetical protein